MLVKTFWLYVCVMLLYVNGQQNNYMQMFPDISKSKLSYIGIPTIATLAILSFFKYRYVTKQLNDCSKFFSKDEVKIIIELEKNEELKNSITNHFTKCFPDIQQYINKFIIVQETKKMHALHFSKKITYLMSLNMHSPEGLVYPVNLNANSLVKQTFVGQTDPTDLLPTNDDHCYIDTQWWVHKHDKIIRLSIDTIAANCYIHCILPEALVIDDTITATMSDGAQVRMHNDFKEHFMMDDKNVNNCVMIGAMSSDKKISAIFADKIDVQYNQQTRTEIQPYCTLNGLLLTVMMHPHKDIIAYSFQKEKKDEENEERMQYEIHIVENVCSAKQDDNIELFSLPIDYYSPVDFGIKKITPFSGSAYLFLTLKGELGMCWPLKNERNENIIHYILKKLQSTIIDFTPDTSRKTPSGFMPHWAFLTDEGEMFVCDFLLPLIQTTLFLVKQTEPSKNSMDEKFDKIYYKDGHCGVLYKKLYSFGKDVPYTKLICYS